jgi:putative multiple sugar transport system ATP-binding protein
MTIAENIFLVNPPASYGVIDRSTVHTRTRELLQKVGLSEQPDTLVTDIGVGTAAALSKSPRLYRNACGF